MPTSLSLTVFFGHANDAALTADFSSTTRHKVAAFLIFHSHINALLVLLIIENNLLSVV